MLSKVSKEFKDQLMRALLQVEPAVLKVLVEVVCLLFLFCHPNFPFNTFLLCVSSRYVCWQFRVIVAAEFVKQNSWPELVPDLRSAIQNSNLISNSADCKWKTINALTVLHALLRPFQVLNLYSRIN